MSFEDQGQLQIAQTLALKKKPTVLATNSCVPHNFSSQYGQLIANTANCARLQGHAQIYNQRLKWSTNKSYSSLEEALAEMKEVVETDLNKLALEDERFRAEITVVNDDKNPPIIVDVYLKD
ncbi:MAG: hypothetical protein ABEJ24_01365 [Candidatus Magasanikbacteria bacterium]